MAETNTDRLARMQAERERLAQWLRRTTPDTFEEHEVQYELEQVKATIKQLEAAITDGHP